MAAWTLTQAREHLNAWLQADIATATGKQYKIGSRTLTRADAAEIRERISFWEAEVTRLESGRGRGARVMRVIPRDL